MIVQLMQYPDTFMKFEKELTGLMSRFEIDKAIELPPDMLARLVVDMLMAEGNLVCNMRTKMMQQIKEG